jgi:6-pyruvoyltetrahydropterin/6-carboxytetrahydropterin synthase
VSENYEVHIAKAEHVFSAAHFITFANHCERLHGHNYHVSAEIVGRLDENHLVIDFLLVRAKLLEITTELDHYVLLPTQHPQIRVEDNGREVTAAFEQRRWMFPSGDCRLLPVPNTTSELLAAYIGKRLFEALGGAAAKIERMNVSVDECDGQIGVWRWQPDAR